MALFPKTPRNKNRQSDLSNRVPTATYYRSERGPKSLSPFKTKQPKKPPHNWLIGLANIAVLAALIFGLGYSLVLNPRPRVLASDFSFHPASVYTAAANLEFNSFQNRNKITFNEQKVINALQKQFPEIASAEVELPFFSEKATIRLNISPPTLKLASGGQTYIIDSRGVVAAKASDLPKVKDLTAIEDQSGFSAIVGQQVLSSSAVSFINVIAAECRYAKVQILSLTLPSLPQELDLRTKDRPYFVKFYLGGDPLIQAGQFIASRNQFTHTGNQPAQYLDVRVSGKIFYK